jgi:gas vesicle protein
LDRVRNLHYNPAVKDVGGDEEERTMYREDQSGSSFMLGIMTGAVIGAGVALLFAPRTGQEMRQQLGEQYRGLAERAGTTAQSLREGAQTIRESAQSGVERVQRAASQLSDRLSTASPAETSSSYQSDAASRFPSASPSV